MAHVPFNLNVLAPITTFFVEEIKTARRHLRKLGYTADFETVDFRVLNEHSKDIDWSDWLKPLEDGKDAVLLSEAGMPCVADPGAKLVAAAQDRSRSVDRPLFYPTHFGCVWIERTKLCFSRLPSKRANGACEEIEKHGA